MQTAKCTILINRVTRQWPKRDVRAELWGGKPFIRLLVSVKGSVTTGILRTHSGSFSDSNLVQRLNSEGPIRGRWLLFY